MFYAVSPNESCFRSVDEVPDYVDQAVFGFMDPCKTPKSGASGGFTWSNNFGWEPKDIVTAWNEVARKLNSVGPTERTGQECKEKWFDLKTRTKKKAVEYKEFVNKTGNKTGKCPKPLTELENRIYSFIDESTISGISQGLSTFQPCSNQAESLRSPGQPRQILAELDVPVQLQQVPTELDVPVQPQQILMELDVNVQQDAGYALCLESPSPSSVLAVQLDTPHEQLGSSSRMREINDETLTNSGVLKLVSATKAPVGTHCRLSDMKAVVGYSKHPINCPAYRSLIDPVIFITANNRLEASSSQKSEGTQELENKQKVEVSGQMKMGTPPPVLQFEVTQPHRCASPACTSLYSMVPPPASLMEAQGSS
ncbi:hypothetical protein lerEdw1_020303 [Lerista edwardsae]|nr:hypothetical protein lerEdw1_020303 [Lerista edwardsae]